MCRVRGRPSAPCASETQRLCKNIQIKSVSCELLSVMAELLWRRREVVAVVSSDVGTDAAALAPPLVAVSSQTEKQINKHP